MEETLRFESSDESLVIEPPTNGLVDVHHVEQQGRARRELSLAEWSERAIRALVAAYDAPEELRCCWYEVVQRGHETGVRLVELEHEMRGAQAALAQVLSLSTPAHSARARHEAQLMLSSLQAQEAEWGRVLGAWSAVLDSLRADEDAACGAAYTECKALVAAREEMQARARAHSRGMWVDRVLEIIEEEYDKAERELHDRLIIARSEAGARARAALGRVAAPSPPTPIAASTPQVMLCWVLQERVIQEDVLTRLVHLATRHVASLAPPFRSLRT